MRFYFVDVCIRLVDATSSSRHNGRKSTFFDATGTSRPQEDRHVSIDNDDRPVDLAVPSETEAVLDMKWRLACHQAAVEHVLTRTALAEKSKAIYRAYVLEERPIDEVAAAFGVPNNTVSQTKTRIERMIAEHEALLGE